MNKGTEHFAAERKRLDAIFAKAMGRGTGYEVEAVAEGSGVPKAKIYAVMRSAAASSCEDQKLYLEEGLALLGQLPVDIANEVLAPYGLVCDRFASNTNPCVEEAAEAAADYAHEVIKWRRLGNFCHRARTALHPKILRAARAFVSLAKGRKEARA